MSESKSVRDTRESDGDARRGRMFLQEGFSRLASLQQRVDALEVQDHSSLAGDRAATEYEPIPNQVVGLLRAAMDHLGAVQLTVEGTGGTLPAMALFTLVRSAFEMTGTGLWLLQPTQRDERVRRSFALTWDNRRQVRTAMVTLGEDPANDEGFNRMEERLRELANRRPGTRGTTEFKLASATNRLAAIAELSPNLMHPPVALWQMASGIAHGNSSMMRAVLEHRQVSPSTAGSATFEVTTSVMTLSAFYDAALTLVSRLIELYNSRNRCRQPIGLRAVWVAQPASARQTETSWTSNAG